MTDLQHSGLVDYSRRNGVGEIALNRPDKLNAISDELTVALREALRTFDGDREARVGIIHGKGKAFSTGARTSSNARCGPARSSSATVDPSIRMPTPAI